MGFLKRMFALTTAAREVNPQPMMIAPPSRISLGYTTDERALSLSTVYRGVQIHMTSAIQLGVDVYRNDTRVDPVPALIRRPDVNTTREAFVEYVIGCLWLTGNAYWLHVRADGTARRPGEIVSLIPLNPHEVTVQIDPDTDRPIHRWRGTRIPERDISHLKMMRVPGLAYGLGPIQAARLEIEGAIDARDYGSGWFSEAGMPSGVLTTDQVLTPEMAQAYKDVWKTEANHDVKVLGQGLAYEPLLLKPADVQFLESQQFSTTQIARLLGVPASLMLAAVQGQSRTYSNVIEEWRGYLQFSAMKALREIETAWSELLPGQQTARFNLDAFLRLDTKARYDAHRTGIEAGFLTVNEVRAMEGLPPLSAEAVQAKVKQEMNSGV